jgi:hypothetical protein
MIVHVVVVVVDVVATIAEATIAEAIVVEVAEAAPIITIQTSPLRVEVSQLLPKPVFIF